MLLQAARRAMTSVKPSRRERAERARAAVPAASADPHVEPARPSFLRRRIIAALGDSPRSPTLALFSAAGVFDAPDVGHLSGVMTGALGAQLAFRGGRSRFRARC